MSTGIHEVRIEHADRELKAIRSVRVEFGKDHWIEVASGSVGDLHVTLGNAKVTATLMASGKRGDMEQAINLLRLYLPASRG